MSRSIVLRLPRAASDQLRQDARRLGVSDQSLVTVLLAVGLTVSARNPSVSDLVDRRVGAVDLGWLSFSDLLDYLSSELG